MEGNAAGGGAVAKALQLPPNTKQAILDQVTAAQEGLSTILTALQDATEAEGSQMPVELVDAIDQVGMQLCSFAEQFAPEAPEGQTVTMSAQEAEIANALSEHAPEIAKSVLAKMARGKVAKATLKVAPAKVVELIKELLDNFMGLGSRWSTLLGGDGTGAAAPEPEPATAAKGCDPKKTLKDVARKANASVKKNLGQEEAGGAGAPAADHAAASTLLSSLGLTPEVLKSLNELPKMRERLERIGKSVVETGLGDPLDDIPNGEGGGNGERKFSSGENISARVRKSIKSAATKRGRDTDFDGDEDENND